MTGSPCATPFSQQQHISVTPIQPVSVQQEVLSQRNKQGTELLAIVLARGRKITTESVSFDILARTKENSNWQHIEYFFL